MFTVTGEIHRVESKALNISLDIYYFTATFSNMA